MTWNVLSTREWATLIWLVVLLVGIVATPSLRSGFADVLKHALDWSILLTIVSLVVWLATVVYAGYRLDVWNAGLMKDTVAWFVLSGLGVIFAATGAAKEPHFFRRALVAAIKVEVFLQFWLNLQTLHIVIEIILQPVFAFLLLLGSYTKGRHEHRKAQAVIGGVMTVLGLLVIIGTIWAQVGAWRSLDPEQTALALGFSIWLPVAMLPYIYGLALVMSYGSLFSLLVARTGQHRLPLVVRLALVVRLNVRLWAVHELRQHREIFWTLARAESFRAVFTILRDYEWERWRKAEASRLEGARLRWYAGNPGVRSDGTLLDQREFEETRDALRYLHGCHMGHYRNLGRYRSDLLDVLGDFERQGLQADHGITMRVRPDGQAWYAWRRTVTGYVFGIGASEAPPSEWLFEGRKPPKRWPRDEDGWSQPSADEPVHWR